MTGNDCAGCDENKAGNWSWSCTANLPSVTTRNIQAMWLPSPTVSRTIASSSLETPGMAHTHTQKRLVTNDNTGSIILKSIPTFTGRLIVVHVFNRQRALEDLRYQYFFLILCISASMKMLIKKM